MFCNLNIPKLLGAYVFVNIKEKQHICLHSNQSNHLSFKNVLRLENIIILFSILMCSNLKDIHPSFLLSLWHCEAQAVKGSLFQCYAVNLVKGFLRKGKKSFYWNNLTRRRLHQSNTHITEIPTKKSGPVVLDYILKKARWLPHFFLILTNYLSTLYK